MTAQEAEQRIKDRVDRFWQDRALEMFRDLTTGGFTTVSDLRIAKGWPWRGSIRFTRDADGVRFTLYLKNARWIGKRVAE